MKDKEFLSELLNLDATADNKSVKKTISINKSDKELEKKRFDKLASIKDERKKLKVINRVDKENEYFNTIPEAIKKFLKVVGKGAVSGALVGSAFIIRLPIVVPNSIAGAIVKSLPKIFSSQKGAFINAFKDGLVNGLINISGEKRIRSSNALANAQKINTPIIIPVIFSKSINKLVANKLSSVVLGRFSANISIAINYIANVVSKNSNYRTIDEFQAEFIRRFKNELVSKISEQSDNPYKDDLIQLIESEDFKLDFKPVDNLVVNEKEELFKESVSASTSIVKPTKFGISNNKEIFKGMELYDSPISMVNINALIPNPALKIFRQQNPNAPIPSNIPPFIEFSVSYPIRTMNMFVHPKELELVLGRLLPLDGFTSLVKAMYKKRVTFFDVLFYRPQRTLRYSLAKFGSSTWYVKARKSKVGSCIVITRDMVENIKNEYGINLYNTKDMKEVYGVGLYEFYIVDEESNTVDVLDNTTMQFNTYALDSIYQDSKNVLNNSTIKLIAGV
jgi:hypothetical protein